MSIQSSVKPRLSKGEKLIVGLFGRAPLSPSDDIWTQRLKLQKRVAHPAVTRASLSTKRQTKRVNVPR